MTVTVYRSTDASAPVLNGTAGSLTTVLDAVLVNGYGSKAAAGWAISFTGTNKRIYRAANGAMRAFFRVQDDGPGTGGAREARINPSEAASNVDTQTARFPSSGQIVCRKSTTADSTAVPWIAVADDRTLHFFNNVQEFPGWSAFSIGEYYSLKNTTDAFNAIGIGRPSEQASATAYVPASDDRLPVLSAVTGTVTGHFVPRTFLEVVGGTAVGKHGNPAHSTTNMVGLSIYPNFSNTVFLSQFSITEPVNAGVTPIVRGRLRGLWHMLHPVTSMNLHHGSTFSGNNAFSSTTTSLTNRSFLVISPTADGTGAYVVETSDTWETN